jgi:hypothetical protein
MRCWRRQRNNSPRARGARLLALRAGLKDVRDVQGVVLREAGEQGSAFSRMGRHGKAMKRQSAMVGRRWAPGCRGWRCLPRERFACAGRCARTMRAGRRAARLSSVEGQVQIAQGNQLLADPALVNTPLFEGTQVVTSGDDGRAELQFDDGSVVRLSPNSSLTLATLRGQGGSGERRSCWRAGWATLSCRGRARPARSRVRFGDSVVDGQPASPCCGSTWTILRASWRSSPAMLTWSAALRWRSTCMAARA